MIEAEYVIDPDAGDFELDNGKRILIGIQASEKLYQDFDLKVTNPGGHSSLPTAENAIYRTRRRPRPPREPSISRSS